MLQETPKRIATSDRKKRYLYKKEQKCEQKERQKFDVPKVSGSGRRLMLKDLKSEDKTKRHITYN